MASSSVFGSSPVCLAPSVPPRAVSSSPDLPSLQQILPNKSHEPAASIVANHVSTPGGGSVPSPQTTSAYWKPPQTQQSSALRHDNHISDNGRAESGPSSPSIVELDAMPAPSTPQAKQSIRQADQDKLEATVGGGVEPLQVLDSEFKAQPSNLDESTTQSPDLQASEQLQPPKNLRNKRESTIEPLHLEQAMARKTVWTPPSVKKHAGAEQLPKNPHHPPSSSSPGNWKQAPIFQALSDTYGCKENEQPGGAQAAKVSYKVVKKRKLIELVPVKPAADTAPKESPEKQEKPVAKRKATKKKQRTLTALATAAYKTPTQPDPAPPSGSLLEYFPADGKAETPVAQDQVAKPKRARKKPAKASKKKIVPPKPILLSPRAALKQVANQDFVFGTSSQLAREQSPSLLRDLQAAIRRSNEIESADFATPINSDAVEPPDQRPKLWDAGARDAEGDLLDLEVIDLVDNSPKLPPLIDEADPFGYHKNEAEVAADADAEKVQVDTAPTNDDSFVNLSDILPSPTTKPSEVVDNDDSHSVSELSFCDNVRWPATPTTSRENARRVLDVGLSSPPKPQVQDEPPRPKYELYTDAQLSKEITSYGFKPVKRRTAMIALLDQCWESKTRMTHGDVRMQSTMSTAAVAGTATTRHVIERDDVGPMGGPRHLPGITESEEQEPPPSAQPPLSPKKPRGRPKKDTSTPTKKTGSRAASKKTAAAKAAAPATTKTTPTKRTTPSKRKKTPPNAVIEIPDSASDDLSDVSRSPSSSPEPTFSSPLPVDLSVSVSEDTDLTMASAPTDDQEALFKHVTKAVTTAPRTTDPSKPSWHEKILMYDPIVLEDLATWLNSGQLTRVGFDGEISPGEVKQWCESKSICCLWKVNLRGKERKRF